HESGRRIFNDLPAIDMLVGAEAARALEERRCRAVRNPARDANLVALALGFDRITRDRGGAERRRMDELQMRQVEQILDDEHVMAVERKTFALRAPERIVHPMEILDERRIGERWITHPHPDPVIPLDYRVAAYPGGRWDQLLTGHMRARTRAVVDEAVIE